MSERADAHGEFAEIARLFRPLTRGAPEALSLLDDAAVIAARPGFDLVVTTDALVEGVHFLADDPLDLVARKLLRVNLSDLAAKAAEPYGYFLTAGWSPRCGPEERALFARGLAEDGETFGLALFGGDTVSTPGPLTISATLLGWVPTGRMIKRSGARPGDRLLVTGPIGGGYLGLQARLGKLADEDGALARAYQLPHPRTELRDLLLRYASAAADVSDGLIADAGHIAEASGLALRLDLTNAPLRMGPGHLAGLWNGDLDAAVATLATAGDDYELVLSAAPPDAERFIAEARALGVLAADIGGFDTGSGVEAWFGGAPLKAATSGYQHAL